MPISKCAGIDLGTTGSVIAMLADDNKTMICCTDESGRRTFPSAIVYDRKTGGVRAGQIALDRRGAVPEPIVSIKSRIGDAGCHVCTGPLTLSPVEVTAEILREMKKQMEDHLHSFPEYEDYVVDRAVITVPAYFASNARENTAKAGELAGLTVEFTLQDPVAAALYYCFKNGIDNGIFMVYDLGGGTFDISIVRVDEGNACVLSIAGSSCLGGDSFDDILARHLLEKLRNSDKGYDLRDMDIIRGEEDRRRFSRLKQRAEIIKKALSSREEFFYHEEDIFKDKSGAKVDLAVTVSRGEFEDLIRPLIDITIEECRRALREAEEQHQITLDWIDGVLLVGGSTHIPLIAETIEENFTSAALPAHTKQPKPLIDEPDIAVGYGAAIAAATTGIVKIERTLTARFEPAIGYGGLCNVRGSLKAEGGGLPEGIYARVTRTAGGCRKDFPVNEDGTFVFEELIYEDEGKEESYSCAFIADGRVLLETGFDAAPGVVLWPTTALSRDYYIENVSEAAGAPGHFRLMEKGTQLPCTRVYTFTINEEDSGAVHLRFLEEKKLLRQIRIDLKEPLPPGTKVRLSISCDLSSRFTAQAEAPGGRLSLQMESSPPPELPAPDDVDAAAAAARSRMALIPEAGRRIVAERMLKYMVTALQDAIEAEDAVQADEILEKIRGFMMPVEFHPPKDVFDQKVRELEKENAGSKKGGVDIAREIRAAADAGHQAYESEDLSALRNAWRILQEIEDFFREYPPPPPERPPMWFACASLARQVMEFIDNYHQLRDTIPSDTRRTFDKNVKEDLRSCQMILSACRFRPSDEECEPYLQTIRRMYPRWEKAAKRVDVWPDH